MIKDKHKAVQRGQKAHLSGLLFVCLLFRPKPVLQQTNIFKVVHNLRVHVGASRREPHLKASSPVLKPEIFHTTRK